MPRKALCNTYHMLLGMSGGVMTDDVIYESYSAWADHPVWRLPNVVAGKR